MKALFAGLSVAVSALAAPVAAQEAPAGAGARAELRAGYDHVSLGIDYDDGTDAFDESDGTSGVAYGVEIGYDVPVNGVLLGAYAGVDFATTDYCSEVFGEDEACLESGRNFTLGVRAGAPVGNSGLVYAKGGYSSGRLELTYDDFEDILEDFEGGENLDGFHLGAGAEFAFAGNTYGKLEYVYTDYGSSEYSDTDFDIGADLTRHQVMVGVGIRF